MCLDDRRGLIATGRCLSTNQFHRHSGLARHHRMNSNIALPSTIRFADSLREADFSNRWCRNMEGRKYKRGEDLRKRARHAVRKESRARFEPELIEQVPWLEQFR